MNLGTLWASARRWHRAHSRRDQRIILTVAAAVVLSLFYVVVVEPVRAYRRRVADEIGEGQDNLERAAHFLGAIDSLRAERADLRTRLEQAKGRLLPGTSGTLGAAALQEKANTIAAEKGIAVQSTQVMKEESAGPFRKVAVRLTLSGELQPFADFVAALEYGQQLTVPFVEVSRRGAVVGQKGPRALQATVEVAGYVLEAAKGGEAEAEAEVPAPPGAEGSHAEGADVAAGEGHAETPDTVPAEGSAPAPPPGSTGPASAAAPPGGPTPPAPQPGALAAQPSLPGPPAPPSAPPAPPPGPPAPPSASPASPPGPPAPPSASPASPPGPPAPPPPGGAPPPPPAAAAPPGGAPPPPPAAAPAPGGVPPPAAGPVPVPIPPAATPPAPVPPGANPPAPVAAREGIRVAPTDVPDEKP